MKNKLKKYFFHSLIKQINEINPKNTKKFWGSINNYKKKNNNCEPAISAKEWEIHYRNLLASSNNDTTDTNQNIENKNHNFSNTSLNVPITRKEIKDCIKKLKKGKSGGPDLIINEFLKVWSNTLVLLLTKLFNKILNSEKFPKIWNISLLTSIYKSGDPSDCGNYRGISITSCLGKVFTSILQKRLSDFLETHNLLSSNQGGFRKNYRTVDHVFILKTIINKYLFKCKKKLYVCFVDFKKAFDSVWRSAMFLKLQNKEIQGKFYNILHDMYSNTLYSCKYQNIFTKPFFANQGVKQGDSLSPTLFNIFVDDIGKYFDTNLTSAVNLNGQKMNHLLYADDLLLISESADGLQNSLDSLQKYSTEWKLDVNLKKTKIIIFSKNKVN